MAGSSKSKKSVFRRLVDQLRAPAPDLDLTGKTALVTGTTSGLGLEACRQLLSHGLSQLIMSARTESVGEARADDLRLRFPNADIQVWVLEMESYDSVISFAERALIDLDRLDMVILNAGTLEPNTISPKCTINETMFQVNYLSTALLARLLIPVLRIVPPEKESSRLTIVTTGVYRPNDYLSDPPTFQSMNTTGLLRGPEELNPKYLWRRFVKPRIFLQPYISRVAEMVNPNEVTINFVVPGLVKDTNLTDKSLYRSWFRRTTKVAHALWGISLEKGAATYIDAVAVKGMESHGETIMFRNIRDKQVSPMVSMRFINVHMLTTYTRFFYIPDEWLDFEDDLWKDTENEFHHVFRGRQTLGATIYRAGFDV
jgi:hypothetical protein